MGHLLKMVIWNGKDSQLDQRRRTAEQGERRQDWLGVRICSKTEKRGRGQPESDVRDRRDLDRCVSDLADCTVLEIGLGKLVGVKVNRLDDERNREQTEANPDRPALSRSHVLGIDTPDSHCVLHAWLDAAAQQMVT